MTPPSAKTQAPPVPPKLAGLQKTLTQLFPVVNPLPAIPPAPNLADNGPKQADTPEPMNIDGEEKKCTHTPPAPPKTPNEQQNKQSPEMASPELKRLSNNASPKPPPVKALFQQTPKISSRHAITTPGGTEKIEGSTTSPTRTRATETTTRATAMAESGISDQQGSTYNSPSGIQAGRTADEPHHKQDPPQNESRVSPSMASRTTSEKKTETPPDKVSSPKEQSTPTKVQTPPPKARKPRQETTTTTQTTNTPTSTTAAITQEPDTAIKDTTPPQGNREEAATSLHSTEQASEDEASTKASSDAQQADTTQTTVEPESSGEEAGNEQNAQAEPSQASDGNIGAGEAMEIEVTTETLNKDGGTTTEAVLEVEEGTKVGEGTSAQSTSQLISYYEWRMKHHQWLNASMRQALGDKEAPEPPHILNLRYPV